MSKYKKNKPDIKKKFRGKNKNLKKFKKGYKGNSEKTISFSKIYSLIDLINKDYEYVKRDFLKIYKSVSDVYEEDQFRDDLQLFYQSLIDPVQTTLWILHPKVMLQDLKHSSDNKRIINGMKELAELAEDHEDLYSFDFPNEFPSFFSKNREYRIETKKFMNNIQKKLSNNVDDLINLTDKFVDELFEICNSFDDSISKLNLEEESNMSFYLISLLLFTDVLLYQREEITNSKIDESIDKILIFANKKKMRRVIDLIENY